MHDITFRTRLFLCFLAIIVMALVLPGLYVRNGIKEEGIDETVRSARREAQLIRMQMESVSDWGTEALGPLFGRMGRALGIRITFVSHTGAVLAESSPGLLSLNDFDNHADRMEIMIAKQEGFGFSIRHSNTLNTDLVYAALPFAATGSLPDGYVRVAVPLSHVEERIAASERQWFAIVGLATLIALILAYVLAAHLERSFKEMIRVVESIATDPLNTGSRRRLHILPGREFRRLAAVNDMADRTEEHVRTIAENKAQLKTILDVMNEGVLVIGEKGRIRLVNPALTRLFPQTRDSEGKYPVEVIPSAEIQQALDGLLSSPPDTSRLITLEIEPRPDMVLSVQLIRPREAVHDVLAVAVFHDISEMARLIKVRKEFVANVSHELRTPLTAIAGYAETLRDAAAEDPSVCVRFAETILRNARHMSVMVEDLLKLSRIESGAVPMEIQPVRASLILSDATASCQPQLATHGLHVETEIDPGLTVLADAHFIAQVFRNLIENACRYAPEGSVIAVRGETSPAPDGGEEALFTVRDDGPGIPEADISRVFERFYRVEKHRSSPASTGLGLAICKHIIERHAGRIWAEPGPGGRLKCTLPLAPVEKEREEKDAL